MPLSESIKFLWTAHHNPGGFYSLDFPTLCCIYSQLSLAKCSMNYVPMLKPKSYKLLGGMVVGGQVKSIQVKPNHNEIKQQNLICKTCP